MEPSYGNLGWQFFVIAAYVVAGVTLAASVITAYTQQKKAREALREEGQSTHAT